MWVLRRDAEELETRFWLQCPIGTGPRHAVFSPNQKVIYVLGELSHRILAFDLPAVRYKNGRPQVTHPNIQPIANFYPSIIPPNILNHHAAVMDSGELCANPKQPRVLYASNRWERHIAERLPRVDCAPVAVLPPPPQGDAVAIVTLEVGGRAVKEIKHFRTGVDVIRGMRVSRDGKVVVVLGEEGGGVEVYEIHGRWGQNWTFVASLRESSEFEGKLQHAVWL